MSPREAKKEIGRIDSFILMGIGFPFLYFLIMFLSWSDFPTGKLKIDFLGKETKLILITLMYVLAKIFSTLSKRVMEDRFHEFLAFGLGGGELGFQLVAEGQQFIHFGDDPVLFGEGWDG